MDIGMGKHGKHFLTLIYKIFFQKYYPITDYPVLFEPSLTFTEKPFYKADILILKDQKSKKSEPIELENIIFWVEIGSLSFEKAEYIISLIGKEKFKHISYGHPVFDLSLELNGDSIPIPISENYQDYRINSIEREKVLIEEAILKNRSLKNTASVLGLTYRSLRYKIEKYDIKIEELLKKELKLSVP